MRIRGIVRRNVRCLQHKGPDGKFSSVHYGRPLWQRTSPTEVFLCAQNISFGEDLDSLTCHSRVFLTHHTQPIIHRQLKRWSNITSFDAPTAFTLACRIRRRLASLLVESSPPRN